MPAGSPPTSGPTFVAHTPQRRVDVTGADRLRYLEDVTSQRLTDASPGTVRGALYLDVHGAPLAMFDVAVLADRVALLTPDADLTDTVVEVLGGRTFLADATFARTDDRVLALRGADAAQIAAAAGIPVPPSGSVRPGGDVLIVGRDGGLDVVGAPARLDDIAQALQDAGAAFGDDADLEAWRIAAGVPAWGREVVAPHLPEEAGILPTHVHLAKGCYPGQEAVARMWMLGRPRRRLAVVAVAGEVAAGWTAGEGRRRVEVTSVSPDGNLALAFVPADAEPGEGFAGEGAEVEVTRLVGAQDDPPGADPHVTRRRDRPRVSP